jgi:MFS family permease
MDHSPSLPPDLPHDAYAALRLPDFRRYLSGNLLALLGWQMQTVAVGWELYQRTHQALHLGLVGLVQVIPVVALALPAGQLIDRLDRRRVIVVALLAISVCSLVLAAVSWWQVAIRWIYVCLFVAGVARAFLMPGKAAFLPLIVPRDRFANAVTWSTSGFQLASILGPGVGGLMIAACGAAVWVYLLDAVLATFFVVQLLRVRARPQTPSTEPLGLRSLAAGVTFVWRTKVVLGAISLDMFAVLLGGATALLPIFAEDILQAGPQGLGWLRSAPGLGALLMSFGLAHRPPTRRAGPALLWAVAGFGAATVVFGFARSFWLAWGMLFLTGGLDMVSVVIRHTLLQLRTPDMMRGRVSAVNGLFISISNELGEFESGMVAQLFHRPQDPIFGPTVSVVSGGIGTILVVLLTAWLFPEVRRCGRLDEVPPDRAGEGSG